MSKNIKLNRTNIGNIIKMVKKNDTKYKTIMSKLTLAEQLEVRKYFNKLAKV